MVIDYLRGIPPAVAYLEEREEHLSLSAATVAELYAGGSGEPWLRLLAPSR